MTVYGVLIRCGPKAIVGHFKPRVLRFRSPTGKKWRLRGQLFSPLGMLAEKGCMFCLRYFCVYLLMITWSPIISSYTGLIFTIFHHRKALWKQMIDLKSVFRLLKGRCHHGNQLSDYDARMRPIISGDIRPICIKKFSIGRKMDAGN